MDENQVLAKKYTWTCALALALIIISLYFNILALITPFLEIHHAVVADEIYSLFGAVKLMWSYKLYIIAVLIVGFSIIFPFVKLFCLLLICFGIKSPRKRSRTISIIEALGKWSMLDIFIVCIVLVLTNDQYFVSSTPRMGVYYFLSAILISLICSILVDSLCEKTYPFYGRKIDNILKFIAQKFTVSEKVIIIVALMVAIVFFAFSIVDSYIEVSAFYLKNNAYSIIKTCVALQTLSPVLAIFIAFVLIVFPFIIFNNAFIFWTTAYHPTFHIKIVKFTRKLSRFMMLDVFCLSLFLFLWEGNIIIPAKSRGGLSMLVVYVFISLLLPLFIMWYSVLRYELSWERDVDEQSTNSK